MSEERCKVCGNGVPTNGDRFCCQKPDECPYDMVAFPAADLRTVSPIGAPPLGASWSPSHYIKTASDRSLIDELKTRGYRVPKRDHVRQASFAETITRDRRMETMLNDDDFMRSLHIRLGAGLGAYLMRSGALPVSHEIGIGGDIFRTTLTVVVEDPEFDRPFPLGPYHG